MSASMPQFPFCHDQHNFDSDSDYSDSESDNDDGGQHLEDEFSKFCKYKGQNQDRGFEKKHAKECEDIFSTK
jgi:hypothetical protein